jgi:hypothetical protein
MVAEEWQHEEWHAIMVSFAGAAALADCGFPEKPAIKPLNHKGHEGTRSSCNLADEPW